MEHRFQNLTVARNSGAGDDCSTRKNARGEASGGAAAPTIPTPPARGGASLAITDPSARGGASAATPAPEAGVGGKPRCEAGIAACLVGSDPKICPGFLYLCRTFVRVVGKLKIACAARFDLADRTI